jgi:tetratricopeptide (TPR) repeat protein
MGGVPEVLIDLSAANAWCPRCFLGEEAAPAAEGLDAYLALLDLAYRAAPASGRLAPAQGDGPFRILGSAYLGAILPDTDAVHNIIGVTFLRRRQYGEAAAAFTEALKRQPDSADAHRNLGTALAATGQVAGALDHLRRAVQLAPNLGGAQYELGNLLLQQRQFTEAAAAFRAALRTLPDFAPAHNNLGIALASLGQTAQAAEEFQRAMALDPEFAESRRNLESARRRR